jgi:glycerol-3-phosphate acyltransferase PlsX
VSTPTRVALDLLGGDSAPGAVVDGALLVLAEQDDVHVVLVGPVDVAQALLVDRPHDAARLSLVAASQVVGMDEDPARAVRSKRDATVRVAARLVRDGQADAVVSIGSTGAALAAAVFTLTRQRGVGRPPLAAVVPAAAGPVVFLDAGATVEATPELLASFALVGAAYARVRLGIDRPRVGLLTVGEEAGKGDGLRKAAPTCWRPCRSSSSATSRAATSRRAAAPTSWSPTASPATCWPRGWRRLRRPSPRPCAPTCRPPGVAADVLDLVAGATARMSPELLGGAVLLGVKGVVVVGHGASTARGVASCVAVAVQAVREGVVPRTAAALQELVEGALA